MRFVINNHLSIFDHLIPNGHTHNVAKISEMPFGGFFERWLQEQERDLKDLISAANAFSTGSPRSRTEMTQSLRELVDRVMSHYENYYRVKSESVKGDVLCMLSPSWRSNLEEAFLWIGGWRPSMAFHLLYSKSGLQLEAGLNELLSGLSTNDLADLAPSQLVRVDELHRQTVRKERELTESLATQQETVADTSMVEMSHIMSEFLNESTHGQGERELMDERVESALAPKESGLEGIFEKADELRLSTLKHVVEILSPIQAIHFLIASAELHLRVHEWGMKKDAHATRAQAQAQ